MLPKVTIVGRLTRDVEVRYSQAGSAIANFGVACSEKYKTASGEQKENTTFVDCSAFGKLAEICNQYLSKGSHVYLDGKLKLDQWTDQTGAKKSKHTVTVDTMQMLDKKQDSQGQQHQPSQYGQPQATPNNNMDSAQRHNIAGGMNRPPHSQQPPSQQGVIPQIDINEEEMPFSHSKVWWL